MKLNWGQSIFLFIILFLVMNLVFVIWVSRQEWNMVEDDYYQKGLKYQDRIEELRNSLSLEKAVSATAGSEGISVHFPEETKGKAVSGKIYLYRPSDPDRDVILPVLADTAGRQLLPASLLSRGKYVLKIDWKMEGRNYYHEIELFFP